MRSEPRELDPGWRFADRFEVKSVLGRGGFGIAYLATDLLRGDLVVVKELAPQGTPRTPEGVLRLDESVGRRLREQFLEEAGLLSRFDIKGVPPIRATFQELGTAYFVTDYVADATTLDRLLKMNGRFSAESTLDICYGLLNTLEAVHAKRILHRDIKPSNVLVGPNKDVYLIDFGAAREWHADCTITHTVQHTPGYAPPEQLSERARRGPATDLYAVCATLFMMLAGVAPPSASDRAAGVALPSLLSIRPELDPVIVRAIEAGLTLAYAGRPQTVADLRDLLSGEFEPPSATTLTELDETLYRLSRFSFDRKACPACKDLLSEPKPLRRYACPVCQNGTIRRREIHDRLCPDCRMGVLHLLKNSIPLAICPRCRKGLLSYRKKSLVSMDQTATCSGCEARFDVKAGKMAEVGGDGEFHGFDYWCQLSGRSTEVWKCPDCPAQFDVLPDGRWEKVVFGHQGSHRTLYPDEWARVAVGLAPGAGNAECDACGADYYVEREHLTLLDATADPNGFAADYLGRLLTLEDARWLGAGKTSPHPGFVCEQCHTELDKDQQYMRLVATSHRRLARFMDQPMVIEDWHRIGQGLPTINQEAEFEDTINESLKHAYRDGVISFDADGLVIWKGEAARSGESRTATLTITHYEISFGGLLMKRRYPTDAVIGIWADPDELHLQFTGERETAGYRITPVELVAHLSSGDRRIVVDAKDLAARLTKELEL
jgi:serine/threonine protein kinase